MYRYKITNNFENIQFCLSYLTKTKQPAQV